MRRLSLAGLSILFSLLAFLSACSQQLPQVPVLRRPPTAPTGLTAHADSYSEITVRWVDNSDNEAGFKVYRNGVLIESVGANVTTFFDKGLQYSTTYTYSVSAYNGVSEARCTITAQVKTLNPPVVVTLDRIGVIKDHDPWLKDLLAPGGEIYLYLAITDGNSEPYIIRIPSSQTITLNDNESKDIQKQVFSTNSVGDELKFVAIAFESDNPVLGLAGNLIMQGLTAYLTAQYGQAGQLVGDLINSQPSESDEGAPMELAESPSDDFVGAVERTFTPTDKWGAGSYQDVRSGDLRLWFTISLPSGGTVTPTVEATRIPKPVTTPPSPQTSPTPTATPEPTPAPVPTPPITPASDSYADSNSKQAACGEFQRLVCGWNGSGECNQKRLHNRKNNN